MAIAIATFIVCIIALFAVISALAFSLKNDKLDNLDTFKTAYWAKHSR